MIRLGHLSGDEICNPESVTAAGKRYRFRCYIYSVLMRYHSSHR